MQGFNLLYGIVYCPEVFLKQKTWRFSLKVVSYVLQPNGYRKNASVLLLEQAFFCKLVKAL